MTALDSIGRWEVETVAAAVFVADDVVETAGAVDQPFALASVSKVLTAITVQVAIEEGSVSLDDDTSVVGAPDGVTLRHLLAHAGGLPPDGDPTPLGPPERRRIYSNVGFDLIGALVEHATDLTFADYARLALVETLGLPSTDLSGSPAKDHASSVTDLVDVLRSVVSGRLLAPETVASMTTPAFPELAGVLPGFGRQDPNPWGLGVEIRGAKHPHWTGNRNSESTWGHFGQSGTFVWWDPEPALGLVVLTDRPFGPWTAEAWPALADEVLAAHA